MVAPDYDGDDKVDWHRWMQHQTGFDTAPVMSDDESKLHEDLDRRVRNETGEVIDAVEPAPREGER